MYGFLTATLWQSQITCNLHHWQWWDGNCRPPLLWDVVGLLCPLEGSNIESWLHIISNTVNKDELTSADLLSFLNNIWIAEACSKLCMSLFLHQKPANILVMGEGPERGRVKIGMYNVSFLKCYLLFKLVTLLTKLSIVKRTWGLPVSSIHRWSL